MFSLPPLPAHLAELIVLGLIIGAATGCGLLVLRMIRATSILSLGERLLFGLALGYGVLGFSMLAMGLLGLIYAPLALILLVLLSLVGYASLRSEMGSIARALRQARTGLLYAPNIFLAVVILLTVGAALCTALLPVVTQDDLMYHLELPRRYIEQHAVAFQPDSTYSLFPQLMEMLYTWGLLLGSDRLPVLLAFSVALIGPAAAALFLGRYLARQGAGLWRGAPLLAAAIFLSSPLMGYVLRAANTDLAQASFDMLAVYAFYLGISRGASVGGAVNSVSQARVLLALSGLCCGLSFSVKYYGFAVPLVLFAALVLIMVVRSGADGVEKRSRMITIFSFAAPAACLAAPWLLRNYFAAGNPIWPVAGSVLGGAYWSLQASPETLLGRAPGLSVDNLWSGIVYLWASLTRPPLRIDGQSHVVSLGPLLLAGLLAVPAARWRAGVGWVAYGAVTYWLLWAFFFSHTSVRYLSTFFLFCSLIGAYALVSVAEWHRLSRWIIGSVVALVLAVLSIEAAAGVGPYLPTVLATDRTVETQYLERYMEDYFMLAYLRDKTPATSKIYVWDGQPRGYYIPRPYVYARLVPLYTGFGGELTSWRARLQELGITHVLVHERSILAPGQEVGVDPYYASSQAFRKRYLGPPLFSSCDYTLYALQP